MVCLMVLNARYCPHDLNVTFQNKNSVLFIWKQARSCQIMLRQPGQKCVQFDLTNHGIGLNY